MELPKEFDDRHWWILLAIAGALIAVASAPVQFVPGFLVGLGLLACGLGQWLDHPLEMGIGPGFTTSRYPWRPSLAGVALTLIGVSVGAMGLWRLMIG